MVYTLVLGTSAERHRGSNPLIGTVTVAERSIASGREPEFRGFEPRRSPHLRYKTYRNEERNIMIKTVDKTMNISLDDTQLENVYTVLSNIFDSVDMFYDSDSKSLSLLLISEDKA
jgi:hypothetical protein